MPLETVRLNGRWRIEDDRLQWILAVLRTGKGASKEFWCGRRFDRCRTRLIASVAELCGDVDPGAMVVVRALPERYDLQERRVANEQETGQTEGAIRS